jgi:hypothetical protein
MCVAGASTEVIEYTITKVNVSLFSPITSVVTARDNPDTGDAIVLIINDALYSVTTKWW